MNWDALAAVAQAAGVLAVQALMAWFMRTVMDKEYEVGLALLSMGASMVFLTALGVMVATLWRSPILGFIVAGALVGRRGATVDDRAFYRNFSRQWQLTD